MGLLKNLKIYFEALELEINFKNIFLWLWDFELIKKNIFRRLLDFELILKIFFKALGLRINLKTNFQRPETSNEFVRNIFRGLGILNKF